MTTKPALIPLLVVFLIAGHVQAQDSSDRGKSHFPVAYATISRTVTDQMGAALPDVTVTLLDGAAVRMQRTKTVGDGSFVFQDVGSGTLQ